MFTIKQLEAKSTSPAGIAPGSEFGGTFTVPSYRSGLFLDPKVRVYLIAPPRDFCQDTCGLGAVPRRARAGQNSGAFRYY